MSNAYSIHSPEEIAELRATESAPYLAEFHHLRAESQTRAVSVMLDNVRMLLWEVSDLMDDASKEPERVTFRPLLACLRQTEENLNAAVGQLAGELGMVSC